MSRQQALSASAQTAYQLVTALQNKFVERLSKINSSHSHTDCFQAIEWLRDKGKYGGGERYMALDNTIFNRASVNISQVHYDGNEQKKLGSATALSTIIHPKHPLASSIHMHISWTEMKDSTGYWRIMADLNPAIEDPLSTAKFQSTLKAVAAEQYEAAEQQGNRYFFIPALKRHRGVSHFYLESYNSGDAEADLKLAKDVGESVIDCYCQLLEQTLNKSSLPSDEELSQQLAYHTLYFFQVLTLDRGTTSGLLVHDQNDVGILASLPDHIDKALLESWQNNMPKPQDNLLEKILNALPEGKICPIQDETKHQLANAVRTHYKQHPEALSLQASGETIPGTVDNHR